MAGKKYDFDAWNEEAENAAVERISEEQTNFRYLIDKDELIIELPSKKIASIPLNITTEDLLAVTTADGSEVHAFIALLERIGQKSTSDNLQGLNIALLAKIAMLYFELVGRITQVAVGE